MSGVSTATASLASVRRLDALVRDTLMLDKPAPNKIAIGNVYLHHLSGSNPSCARLWRVAGACTPVGHSQLHVRLEPADGSRNSKTVSVAGLVPDYGWFWKEPPPTLSAADAATNLAA